jgi:AraC-like DNA-binding protein
MWLVSDAGTALDFLVEDTPDLHLLASFAGGVRLREETPRPSVAAVALACGYGNVGHFSRDFRRCFGINPSQARRG